MANLARGITLGATEQVTNAKLHALVDSATISGIVNADIDASAGISASKFDDVDGGKLTGLANISSAAGKIPAVNLTSVDPFVSGMIVLWSGSVATIPNGWLLCDGNNSTPDLRDRFIMGAGSTYAVNATGGASTINIAHTHTGNTDGVTFGGSSGVNTAGSLDTKHYHAFTTGTSGSATQSILNPYFALAYIMKN